MVLLVLLIAGIMGPAAAQVPQPIPARASSQKLTLEEVRLKGATRTPVTTVYRYLELEPGQDISQQTLIQAVAQLKEGGLFRSVSFFTMPGSARGRLVLILEVEEHAFDFRWAAGNTDLDGWYLVPAMLAYDNPLGRGGLFDFQFRIGYRHSGVLLRYQQPPVGDSRTYWGAQLSSLSTDRPYFWQGLEYRHTVYSGGVGAVYGRSFGDAQRAEVGLQLEAIDVANSASVHLGSEDGTLEDGQSVPAEDLPAPVQEALGTDFRAVLHTDWQYDTRAKRLRAGTPTGGFWGRAKGTFSFQGDRSHLGLQTDWRKFQEVPGGVLAGRLRAAWVGDEAAFYDRLYLGGVYSVRGFPVHALSAPGGDTWLVSGSLEYRTSILGNAQGSNLAGVLFLDAGASGQSGQTDPYSGVALGAGYGVRWKVWWLDWVGVDVGFPLTERPVDMNFQVTASIGWSF
jgi:outer membrane protein assembly factor BamA